MRALHVIAHPDDEDPFTLTHLARDLGWEVVILSLTRGECGQNALGDEVAEALGYLRTHEMLAAARAYGAADVLFASAFDYGYSRRLGEARARWDVDRLVADVALAIDTVRPARILSRFAEDMSGEHAHHIISAEITRLAAAAATWQPDEVIYGVDRGPDPDLPAATIDAALRGYLRHRSQVPAQLVAYRWGTATAARAAVLGDEPPPATPVRIAARAATGEPMVGGAVDVTVDVAVPSGVVVERVAVVPASHQGPRTTVRADGERFIVSIADDADALSLPAMRSGPEDAMLTWRHPGWRLRALPPPPLTVEVDVVAGGERTTLRATVTGPRGEPLALRPRVEVDLAPHVTHLAPGARRSLRLGARGPAGHVADLELALDPPVGGVALRPPYLSLAFGAAGRTSYSLELAAEPDCAPVVLTAAAHKAALGPALAVRRMPAPAPLYVAPTPVRVFTHAVEVAAAGAIAYLEGTGDSVPQALVALGAPPRRVSRLDAAALDGVATLILGLRAYHVHRTLGDAAPFLADFCARGGHLVTLAQTAPYDPSRDAPVPGDLPDDAEEVCEEDTPVRLLAPDHPLLARPNRLTAADFDGWFEQRGSRFWRAWDPAWIPLVELRDPDRAPQQGAWLSATVGRGRATYIGLALHRQLPLAVPGAYRILANLIS
ncbi:MAG TPA: PIG-L family deacetylase [Kofleriaceae bacterium]|nr:PIG-L family deacetylase [Kofleriaceae bacterium]